MRLIAREYCTFLIASSIGPYGLGPSLPLLVTVYLFVKDLGKR